MVSIATPFSSLAVHKALSNKRNCYSRLLN